MKALELFSGIGGWTFACENTDIEIVQAYDIDESAIKAFSFFHNKNSYGDITQLKSEDLPDVDIIFGSSPCQSFSQAGNREGFKDERGNLFFDFARIVKDKQPKVFVWENVKGVLSHDQGKTFEIIQNTFRQMGYNIYHEVLDAKTLGGACMRPRIFLVGIQRDCGKNPFSFPQVEVSRSKVYDLLEDKVSDKLNIRPYMLKHLEHIEIDYPVAQWRRTYFRIYDNICPTFTANMGTGGNNVPYIKQDGKWRKLTPTECFRIMGYNVSMPLLSNMKLYKLIGNSISLDVSSKIVSKIIDCLG